MELTPARIGEDVRFKIISLFFRGQSEQETANSVGVHVNTVRNVIGELKAGRFPQFESLVPYVQELRRLSQRLRSDNLALEKTAAGLAIHDGITKLGIEPAELRAALDFFQRVAPLDLPIQQFVKIALHIINLENRIGLSLPELDALAIRLGSEIPRQQNEHATLTQTISRLRTTERQVQQDLQTCLDKNKVTQQTLNQYAEDKETLRKADLGIGDIKPVANLIRQAGEERVLEAARELARLTKKTGMSPEEIVAQYKQTVDLEQKSREENARLQGGNEEARREKLRLQREIDDLLARNQLTSKDLSDYLAMKEKLASRGIAMDRPGKLEKVIGEMERLNYNAQAVLAYLASIDGLEQRKAGLEKDIADKSTQLEEASKKAAAEQERFEKLQRDIAEAEASLTQLRQQSLDMSSLIELAQTFFKLLYDPASVVDFQIASLVDMFQNIQKAMGDVRRLPIDYKGLQDRFHRLVERVLGDTLLSRETLDREMGKVNHDWAEFYSAKKQLEVEKAAFFEFTRKELLNVAVREIGKGNVFVATCRDCKSITAVQRGPKSRLYYSFKCSLCSHFFGPDEMKQVPA